MRVTIKFNSSLGFEVMAGGQTEKCTFRIKNLMSGVLSEPFECKGGKS